MGRTVYRINMTNREYQNRLLLVLFLYTDLVLAGLMYLAYDWSNLKMLIQLNILIPMVLLLVPTRIHGELGGLLYATSVLFSIFVGGAALVVLMCRLA